MDFQLLWLKPKKKYEGDFYLEHPLGYHEMVWNLISKIKKFQNHFIFMMGISVYEKMVFILKWTYGLLHHIDGLIQERCNSIADVLGAVSI